MPQWQPILTVLSKDKNTSNFIPTYSSYALVAKKSSMAGLDDLANKTIVFYNKDSLSNYQAPQKLITEHHIQNVRWKEAKNLDEALSMVAQGRADVVWCWKIDLRNLL